MALPSLLCMLLLICLISATFILPSSSKTISLDLFRVQNLHSSQNPKDIINNLAKSTLQRAYHLKLNQNNDPSTTSTPLVTSTGGDYSISLSLGTPPQKIPAYFDTGSSLVWVPCTSGYSCPNCTQNNAKITIYKPKKSTTKRSIKCNNEKCRWLDQPDIMSSCQGCTRGISGNNSCSRPCFYAQAYGSGDTIGVAIFENLNLQGKVVSDFIVGCSLVSHLTAEGIAGFGRSPLSLPNQLNLSKFSYCLLSHAKFDGTSKSSKLILGGNHDTGDVAGMKYTPLVKSPPMLPFNQYYYIQLDKITVGKKTVKVPQNILVPDLNGNGGIIVDSGSTLTYTDSSIFDPIVNGIVAQMSKAQLDRVGILEVSTGGVLCIDTTGEPGLSFPLIVFRFHGGAAMDLPVGNYISAGGNILCLPFVNTTISSGVGLDGSGPAMIMGNYQQQNFNIEYDLKNERFGVMRQTCG